jgi:RNA polymerase sigma factor (sigma-70 family)
MTMASVLNSAPAARVARGASMRARHEKSCRATRDAKCSAPVNGNENHFASLQSKRTNSTQSQAADLSEATMVTNCSRSDAGARLEEDLVDAAKKGDELAFEELVERHKRRIYLYALRMMGNPEDAEDVLQSSLLQAFLHLPQFEGKSSFSTWITRIAINEALMIRRKRRGGREVSIEESAPADDAPAPMEFVDARPNPEHRYAQQEWQEIIRRALGVLRPAMRLTLIVPA